MVEVASREQGEGGGFSYRQSCRQDAIARMQQCRDRLPGPGRSMPLRVVPGLLWVLGIRAMTTTMLAMT